MIAESNTLAVIPILVGPLQVVLAILPAMLAALVMGIIRRLKPLALAATAKLMWRKKLATASVVATIALAVWGLSFVRSALGGGSGVQGGNTGDWPAFRGDIQRSACAAGQDKFEDPGSGGVRWTFDRDIKTFYSSPALVGDQLYISAADKGVFTDQGAIYCIDADKGTLIWSWKPGGYRATFSSPSISGKYLVCGEGLHFVYDARVFCLDISGKFPKKLWEMATSSHVESSPCIYKGKAYVGSGDDGLWCIDLEPQGGKANVRWHLKGTTEKSRTIGKDALTDVFADCEASPIAFDNKVFFCLGEDPKDGKHRALRDRLCGCRYRQGDLEDRCAVPGFRQPRHRRRQSLRRHGQRQHGRFGRDGQAETYPGAAQARHERGEDRGGSQGPRCRGQDLALDLASGKRLWEYTAKETILGTAAIDEKAKRLYTASRDGMITCLGLDGRVLGQLNSHSMIVTSPALGRQRLYVLTDNGSLYGLSRQTMHLDWETKVASAGPFISSPIVGRGRVYVGTAGEGIKCLGQPGTRQPVWAGFMGGGGIAGCIDGSMMSQQGERAWRFPRGAGMNDEPPVEITAAAACLSEPVDTQQPETKKLLGIYAPLKCAQRTGLVKLTAAETSRRSEEKWFYPTTNPVRQSAAISGGRVFVVDGTAGEKGRNLHVLRAADGACISKMSIADNASGQFVISDGSILVYDGADGIRCLRPAGEAGYAPAWSASVDAPVGSPLVHEHLACLASGAGRIVIVSMAGGQKLAELKLPARPTTGAIAFGYSIVIGTEQGVVALGYDGQIHWRDDCGLIAAPLVATDERLACIADNQIRLYSAGGRRLAAPLPKASPEMPPIMSGDSLLYSAGKALIRAEVTEEDVRPSTAPATAPATAAIAAKKQIKVTTWTWAGKTEESDSSDLLDAIITAPVLADGNVYFGTKEKGLACMRARKQ